MNNQSDTPETAKAWHDVIAQRNSSDRGEDTARVTLADLAEKLETIREQTGGYPEMDRAISALRDEIGWINASVEQPAPGEMP